MTHNIDTMPSWDYLADEFGHAQVAAVDKAVAEFLADAARNRGGSIPKDDLYLVSEGVAYAVFLALLETR